MEPDGRQMYTFATLGKKNGLDLRPTSLMTIPDPKNRGLFATRPFLKNELVTEYTGEYITREQAVERRKNGKASHIKSLTHHQLIDGNRSPKEGQGVAQFTNDATKTGGNNTQFYTPFDKKEARYRIFLKATRDIACDEEIFVCYGNDYWVEPERLDYAGKLTTNSIVKIKVEISKLRSEYYKTYEDEEEDKSEHHEVDFIIDAKFEKTRLWFTVQWTRLGEQEEFITSNVSAKSLCHNKKLFQDFYKHVDPSNKAKVPKPSKIATPLTFASDSKVCTKCNVVKSTTTEFRKRGDGHRGQCKDCESVVERQRLERES
jgi:hypothetical protein